MLMSCLIVQLILGISVTVAIVTPSQLYGLVDKIVDVYMNGSCLVVMSSGGYVAASYATVVYVIPYAEETQNDDSISTAEENYKMMTMAPALELGCTGYVIQTENPGRQLRLIEKSLVRVNQRNQRKFIFLPMTTRGDGGTLKVQDEVLDSQNFHIRSVLLEKSVQYFPDMIFTLPNDADDRVALLTHRFSGTVEMCQQEMTLDTYSVAENRFELAADLFPDKTRDLEGKVLIVAIFHYNPAIVINEDNGDTTIDGTEWRFAQEFARHHNCTLKALIDGDRAWGVIYENATGKGVVGSLVENKADLAICSLFMRYDRSLFLDFSPPFHRSGVRCLVPAPHQLPQWMSPIRPFTPRLWLTFAGMTILSAIFTGIVNQLESIIRSKDSFRTTLSEASLTVWGIMLLQGLTKDPKSTSWAALSITLLIVSLLLSTAYGSSLASALTVPRYEAPIDTRLELAASGIPWVAADEDWINPIHDADEPEMITLVKNFKHLSVKVLSEHPPDGDVRAIPIERIHGHYVLPAYLARKAIEKMHLMKSDIYWAYCVALLRKSSPFTKWFSKRVLEVQASGIPHYWQTDVALQHLDRLTQLAVKTDNTVEYRPTRITSNQLLGAFSLLGIGLVISGLVFLGEIFSNP